MRTVQSLTALATVTVGTGAGSAQPAAVSGIYGAIAYRFEAANSNSGNIAIGSDNTVNAVGPVKAICLLAPGEDIILPVAAVSGLWLSADVAAQKLLVSAVGP